MATRAIANRELAGQIRAAWKESGLSQAEVWRLFRNAGGHQSDGTIKAWVQGWRIPQADDYDLLAAIINEALEAQGKQPMLPRLLLVIAPVRAAAGASANRQEVRQAYPLRAPELRLRPSSWAIPCVKRPKRAMQR